MTITAREFLQLEKVGELWGYDIKADRYGEKFVFIPNEALHYMDEEMQNILESITESKRDYKSIGALKYGTLFCLGYNI